MGLDPLCGNKKSHQLGLHFTHARSVDFANALNLEFLCKGNKRSGVFAVGGKNLSRKVNNVLLRDLNGGHWS